MTQLDSHIERVERYGFERAAFPVSYNGHRVDIISNDAHYTNEDRLFFDFTLYCRDCKKERGLSGRFPVSCDDQIAGVVNAKVAVFDRFKYEECV
jgi:hypothetical protein